MDVVERYFRGMQRGPEGEEELVALFADYLGEVGPLLAGEPEVTMASPVWATGVGR